MEDGVVALEHQRVVQVDLTVTGDAHVQMSRAQLNVRGGVVVISVAILQMLQQPAPGLERTHVARI